MRQNFSGLGLAIATSIVMSLGQSANAAIVTYADFTSWKTAAGSVATVTIPDAGDFQYFGTGDASVMYGGVLFSQSSLLSDGNLFNVGPEFSQFPPVISSQDQTFGVPNILITFSVPINAFALNFGTFAGDEVTFTLSNGSTFQQDSTGSSYAVPDFAGAKDSTSFTSVLVTSHDVLNLNNVSFNIAAIPDPSTLVPEPSTLSLVGLGGVGLAIKAIRRRRNANS